MSEKINKVLLAYSGGLDTSAIIPWLIDTYHCEVICYCANVGQEEELDHLEDRAKASGATKLIIDDLVEPLCKDYIWPLVKSGAIYERKYYLGTSIARPIVAKRLVKSPSRNTPTPSLTAAPTRATTRSVWKTAFILWIPA